MPNLTSVRTLNRTDTEKSPANPALYDDGEKANRTLSRKQTDYDTGADLRRLRTLGDGPVAPVAAAYNARAPPDRGGASSGGEGGEEDQEMGVGRGEGGWVEPGLKGWLCVLGVSVLEDRHGGGRELTHRRSCAMPSAVSSAIYLQHGDIGKEHGSTANFIDGMTNSFGVFQEYYTYTHPIHTAVDATSISWIGSIQYTLCPLLGCIAGPLFDAGYLKSLIGIGGGLYVFSLMMTSIATQYWQIILAHGLGVGLGMGIFFSPSVSTLSHHFQRSKYRTVAYGLQATGSSIGGIVYPIMMRALIPKLGFGWAMRICELQKKNELMIVAFLVLGVIVVAFFTLSRVHPPRKQLALLSPVVCELSIPIASSVRLPQMTGTC